MKKLNGESMNIVDENIAKLKELFPDVFSEGNVCREANYENIISIITLIVALSKITIVME